MKKLIAVIALLISGETIAESLTGKLEGGGGIDDLGLSIILKGKSTYLYCDGHCADWFDEDAESGGSILKKKLKGHKVEVDYAVEKNNGRIAGPDDQDELYFIKKIKILP